MMAQTQLDSLTQSLKDLASRLPDPSLDRPIRIRGSELDYPLNTLESFNVGNPAQSIPASVGETDIDLQISTPFYPKTISMVFSVVNTSDYVEFFLMDQAKANVLKKIGSTHYIATTTDSVGFADSRPNIPRIMYPKLTYLRIAFQNKSATAYTFTSAWDVWIPTSFG